MSDTGFLGLAAALINRHRVKIALKKVNESNIENKGIDEYLPSQIEAFFDVNEQIGNMAFSGGLNGIRARAISMAAECAYVQGYSVIVMHCDNKELENTHEKLKSGCLRKLNQILIFAIFIMAILIIFKFF